MKRAISKALSLLLAFSMVASLAITTALASPGNRLLFEFPEETYGTDVTATVDVYKGVPTSSSATIASCLENGQLTEVALDVGNTGCAMPTEPGTYCYTVYGEGNGDYYPVIKLFNLTAEDIANGDKTIALEGGKCGTENGDGYEPGYMPSEAPATYTPDARGLINWTDEVLAHFTVQDQGYKTPAFDGKHAANEFTSQEEMMDFIENRVATCSYMYQYSAGTTGYYEFDLPMVLITTTEIPAGATLEEAAACMTSDGKVNIWYQSQIHPNEPASGEASLVMLDNFAEKQEYKDMLETANIILIPRINPDGSYLFSRATTAGFDMNRDHTSLKSVELAQLHTAWRLFQTEVVIDTHEFTYYGYQADPGQMYNADDIQTTPASSLNNDANLNAMALDMAAAAFAAEQDTQDKVGEGHDPLRVNHYGGNGWTTNPPIGRCYFGLLDCLSFLIETRGIGAGRNNFERRVLSQEVAATAYIEYAAEHAQEIINAVANARAKLIKQGKTYSASNMFALKQTASGNTQTDYTATSYTYKLDGTEVVLNTGKTLSLNDTATNARVRPTAYVIPADAKNIEQILYIMDNQGAEYYTLNAGTTARLQQYYFISETGYNSCVAGLRSNAEVTFPKGAYVFPMDQLAANVIASILELDDTDSDGYDGTLYQYKCDGVNPTMDYDRETNNFPLYRYTGNNPRKTLVSSQCTIVLDYPEDVPVEDVVVTMFDGVPQWRQKNGSADVEAIIDAFTNPTSGTNPKLNVIEPNEDGTYTVDAAHGYSYLVRGKEAGAYYSIIKLFIVSADDLKNGTKTLAVKTGPMAGTGFEAGNNNPVGVNGETAPAGFDQGVQYGVPVEGTDEMEYLMGTDDLKDYAPFTTPAFQEGRAMYQATTQQEMMDFIADYAEDCPYMHVYSMGTTSNYGYDYPLIVYTKKAIPDSATMDDAAEILREGGKPIIWQQAQIHPYEPAAGESALVMIQELCGDYGKRVLDDIDVVLIPRVNVEGGFLFWRGDISGTDMNRDHMVLSTEQNAMLHDAYYKFMPHVVIDNHEFFFSEMGNYNNDPEQFKLNDFQITGATSLNDAPEITDITTNIVVDRMHKDLQDYGFRPYHYGITSNNPIGRAYYGLGNAISVLIESHGADGALFAFPRRVYGQVIAAKSAYESTIENAERIVTAVNEARAEVAEKGRTYEESDILVLKQSASGAVKSPTPLAESVADIYGNIYTTQKAAISLQDTVVRSRVRPTAYVVPADVDWLDDLTYILDHQSVEYFMLPRGTSMPLQQYYYISKDGRKSCIADLRDEATVTFANGCLMIPMDQEVGNIIGMLMEPDVGDSSSYNGTLFQYGLLAYDADNNFPLYRYTGDNPRSLVADGNAALDVVPMHADAVNTMKFCVSLSSEKGIGAAVLSLSNDSALELIAVDGLNWTKGDKNLVVNEDIAPSAVKQIELTFRVTGTVSTDTVTVKLLGACTIDEEDLSGVSASAKGYIVGDANGDGRVSASDLVRLRTYIGMNGEGVAIGQGGDLNN
nr:hypothetical protein [Oscillospiraceae bacterium]